MEQMQPPNSQVLPHIVQLIRTAVNREPTSAPPKIQSPQIIHISHPSLQTSQGNVTYQQTLTTEAIHIPVTSHISHDIQNQQIQTSQNLVMSCQSHLQGIHQPLAAPMQSQVLQTSDMSQSLQITSHVILPPVFKQHMLVNDVSQQYYSQYEFQKDDCVNVQKIEPEVPLVLEKTIECKTENTTQLELLKIPLNTKKKRNRGKISNPNKWACNVRKLKHQRGEAYVSRRGKFVPERHVKNTKDCLKSCKYKCSERISDTDREHIFKAFYSLNANEKKHFLLNTTERNYTKQDLSQQFKTVRPRKYVFKYFFLVRAVRYVVCKNFYLGTLAISQKPIYNVHSSKSDMNIPKPDGRGLSEASTHKLPSEVKDKVRKHIMSFTTEDSKPIKQFSTKKQYLEPNLTIKQMYTMYFNDCSKENMVAAKESMYRKIFKQEFNLHFKKVKSDQQLCCKCKKPVKKK